MFINHKLTNLLSGRSLQQLKDVPDGFLIQFQDGSALHIKTAPGTAIGDYTELTGIRVSEVTQVDCLLAIKFQADNRGLQFRTSEPAASVLLRNASGVLEYAD